MAQNMYCSGHKSSNDSFRDGWDAVWGKKNKKPVKKPEDDKKDEQ